LTAVLFYFDETDSRVRVMRFACETMKVKVSVGELAAVQLTQVRLKPNSAVQAQKWQPLGSH